MIEAFSTRRAEIEKAMADRGLGKTAENQRAARRVTLMTRDPKREAEKSTLMAAWEKQARELGFDATALKAQARAKGALPREVEPAREAVEWAVAHLAEREPSSTAPPCSPARSPGGPAPCRWRVLSVRWPGSKKRASCMRRTCPE